MKPSNLFHLASITLQGGEFYQTAWQLQVILRMSSTTFSLLLGLFSNCLNWNSVPQSCNSLKNSPPSYFYQVCIENSIIVFDNYHCKPMSLNKVPSEEHEAFPIWIASKCRCELHCYLGKMPTLQNKPNYKTTREKYTKRHTNHSLSLCSQSSYTEATSKFGL